MKTAVGGFLATIAFALAISAWQRQHEPKPLTAPVHPHYLHDEYGNCYAQLGESIATVPCENVPYQEKP